MIRRVPKLLAGLALSAILLCTALVLAFVALRPASPGEEVGLEEVQKRILTKRVTSVLFLDHDSRLVVNGEQGQAWAAFPRGAASSSDFLAQLANSGVPVRIDQQSSKGALELAVQFVLPLLLLANLFGLFIVLARGGASQVKDLFAFSRLRAREDDDRSSRIGFEAVAAADEAVEELAEIRDYLRDPARFAALGAQPPKGVLLYGPPGCGKTLLARAVAGETGVPFFFISGSEFVESLVGVGAARVRDLFRQAVAKAPAIVFIDELDAAGRRRGAGIGGGHDEREQTLNELLVQMDGFAPSSGVVVIGATNRPDILDPALLRPGRFDRHIVMDAPDVVGREAVLALHAKGRRLHDDADLARIARATPGFSGADLANVLNEAALLAVRRRAAAVSQADLVEGVQRVLNGPRRRGRLLSDAELRRISFHEAGHVVVAHHSAYPAEVTRVSIVARGRDTGRMEALPRTDKVVLSDEELRAELVIAMAGSAAERLACGQLSTAGEADLERATDLARRYVGRYGLSKTVGRIRVLAKDAEVFLGRDLLTTHNASGATLEAVDQAVRDLLAEAESQAQRVLEQHRSSLEAVAQALLERETLDQPEIDALLKAAKTRGGRARPARSNK